MPLNKGQVYNGDRNNRQNFLHYPDAIWLMDHLTITEIPMIQIPEESGIRIHNEGSFIAPI